jgi:hypothetical protein
MNLILLGAIAMLCFTVALFFIRFWKTTRDRFFLFFAIAFFIEGCGRVALGVIDYSSEQEPLFYLLRLLSFSVILFAIVDKNWLNGADPLRRR